MGWHLPYIQKSRPKSRKAGIVMSGDRELCLGDVAWQQPRKETHDRAGGKCERVRLDRRCNRLAPLHDECDEDYGEVMTPSGHAHHKNGTRGLGDEKRDDRLENLEWDCYMCHKSTYLEEGCAEESDLRCYK